MPKETLLSASDVAKILNVTVQSISNYCERGYFPGAFRIGDGRTSPWRIPQKDVENFIKNQRGQLR